MQVLDKSNQIDSIKRHFDSVSPSLIDWEFYSKYIDKEPPFGQIGAIVFIRTYSRLLPKEGRREYWMETVLRVCEYSLASDTVSPVEDKRSEARELFDLIFNCLGFPSGRALWVAGTEVTRDRNDALYNCSFVTIDSISKLAETFYMLMNGAGVGFSLEEKYTSKMPLFYTDKVITNRPYEYNEGKLENTRLQLESYYSEEYDEEFDLTSLTLDDEHYIERRFYEELLPHSEREPYRAIITVGDSREGWVNCLRIVLSLLTWDSIKQIDIDYNYVRPEGSPLKTFGGRASGPGALSNLMSAINEIVNEYKGDNPIRLITLQLLDIINNIGLAVVIGGVRRSSEIGLADKWNLAFEEAKLGLWDADKTSPRDKERQRTRVMSNNSMALYENPGLQYFIDIMSKISTNGEPGFYSLGNAQRRSGDRNRVGTNPCGEILLDDRQVCNLTEAVAINHCKVVDLHNGYQVIDFMWESWERCLQLLTRVCSRVTLGTMWHPTWNEKQQRDRLLGIGLTGVVELFNIMGWDREQQQEFWATSYNIVRVEADRYHNHLGINRSLLVSTIKPSGTLSLLAGCSSGIHAPYAPYYIRRVRVSKNDPVAQALRSLGIPVVPENAQGDDIDSPICNTWVFSFPMKSDCTMRAIDEPAIKQLERYEDSMDYYTEHNTSCTITCAPDEWEKAAHWLYENYDSFVGVSFLPRFDPSEGSPYPNLPFESCTQHEYELMKASMPRLSESDLIKLISQFEVVQEEYDLGNECSTGACPIR